MDSIIRFERVDQAGNVARFYVIEQRRTLWNEPATVATWGRIGGIGRCKVIIHPTREQAREAARKAAERRVKRGYVSRGLRFYQLWRTRQSWYPANRYHRRRRGAASCGCVKSVQCRETP